MRTVHVTRTHLELRGPHELRPPTRDPVAPPRLERRWPITAPEYRALYTLVGDQWFWRDRLAWEETALDAWLASPAVEVWVAHLRDDVAGYFELKREPGGTVEIMYFGLAPAFIGRGLGGWLLVRAAERAFAGGGARVVLNTCTLDGPHALPNYLARGFRIVREEQYEKELP